jgi:AraC-like DNA-binding protein
MTPQTTTNVSAPYAYLHAGTAHYKFFTEMALPVRRPRPHYQLKPADISAMHGVKAYVQQHFLDDNLSLKLLCQQFGLNEFKLKKGFKMMFAQTVFGYAHQLKMQLSRDMLMTQNMNVNETAELLGYSTPNHFSAAFKKMYGFCPGKLLR